MPYYEWRKLLDCCGMSAEIYKLNDLDMIFEYVKHFPGKNSIHIYFLFCITARGIVQLEQFDLLYPKSAVLSQSFPRGI